jgi:hypothetical protein
MNSLLLVFPWTAYVSEVSDLGNTDRTESSLKRAELSRKRKAAGPGPGIDQLYHGAGFASNPNLIYLRRTA